MYSDRVPLISIIVPVYGVEQFLDKCIMSILAQTYRNIEVILVDDGSPDGSGRICDSYAALDDRVAVIHQENGGTGKARNAGLDAAHGKYISFVDGDDLIHPGMLAQLYSSLVKHGGDISVCLHRKIKEHQNVDFDTPKGYHTSVRNGKDVIRLCFHKQFIDMVSPWNKLYKREVFSAIRFPEGKMMEDLYTTYKTFFAAEKVVFIDAKLYYYTQRCSSVIYSSAMKAEYTIEAFDTADEYCRRYITDEEHLHRSLMILAEWKANACLDAYYAAHRRGQTAEMERYRMMYLGYKEIMQNGGYRGRTAKLALFDIHPEVFKLAYHTRNMLLGVNDSKKR